MISLPFLNKTLYRQRNIGYNRAWETVILTFFCTTALAPSIRTEKSAETRIDASSKKEKSAKWLNHVKTLE